MDASGGYGLEDEVSERSLGVHQTVGVENDAPHDGPTFLQGTVWQRATVPVVLAGSSSCPIGQGRVSLVEQVDVQVRSTDSEGLVVGTRSKISSASAWS